MLFIFGGLPGTGKSTLSAALARHNGSVYVRIDTIEQALRDSGLSAEGPAGYIIGYRAAAENLRQGRSVVADSVNPLGITRKAWREVATQNKVPFLEIEIICSNEEEHRRRVESRSSNVPNLIQPTWKEVVERDYEPWLTDHLVIDTAGHTSDESVAHLITVIETWRVGSRCA